MKFEALYFVTGKEVKVLM